MEVLKRENWWIWLVIFFLTSGTGVIALSAILGNLKKNVWYGKPVFWLATGISFFVSLGTMIFSVLPFSFEIPEFLLAILSIPVLVSSIAISVFFLTMLVLSAGKLQVPGKELYLSPYIWLLCIIVPVIGWIFLIVIIIYLFIWILVSLRRGNGEEVILS